MIIIKTIRKYWAYGTISSSNVEGWKRQTMLSYIPLIIFHFLIAASKHHYLFFDVLKFGVAADFFGFQFGCHCLPWHEARTLSRNVSFTYYVAKQSKTLKKNRLTSKNIGEKNIDQDQCFGSFEMDKISNGHSPLSLV